MDEWFSRYAAITPFGVLGFTHWWWVLDGQNGWSEFAGLIDLGILSFLVLVVIAEGLNKMFYSIAQHKRKEKQLREEAKGESEKEVVNKLWSAVKGTEEEDFLKRILVRAELGNGSTTPATS